VVNLDSERHKIMRIPYPIFRIYTSMISHWNTQHFITIAALIEETFF
jgi:hypothetical protein